MRRGQPKAKRRNVREAARMLAMARTRLADARLGNVRPAFGAASMRGFGLVKKALY